MYNRHQGLIPGSSAVEQATVNPGGSSAVEQATVNRQTLAVVVRHRPQKYRLFVTRSKPSHAWSDDVFTFSLSVLFEDYIRFR